MYTIRFLIPDNDCIVLTQNIMSDNALSHMQRNNQWA